MGRALSEVMTAELEDTPGLHAISSGTLYSASVRFGLRAPAAPGISTERDLALAAGATQLGYGQYTVRGGRVEARFEIEDLASRRITTVVSESKGSGELLSIAASLARPVSDHLQPFGTSKQEALEAWAQAVETPDVGRSITLLQHAIAVDPNFGPPYRALAENQARQDRALAVGTLERGVARGASMPARDRLRLELALATLRDDSESKERAAAALVKLEPVEPANWSSLAEIAMNRRDYRRAADALQKFVELEPANAAGWNQLGYAAAYAGDLATAESVLRKYEALSPGDANPLDSLGDVNLLNGRLREAETYYLEALKKHPGFLNHADLYKAAMARLMSGDTAGADALAKQYVEARMATHDPAVDLFGAEWLWASGRRTEGYRRMQDLARAAETGGRKELAARAYAEAAIWSLMLGDRAAAEALAAHAAPLAGPASDALVVLARFLSQPQASGLEWASRADRAFSAPAAVTIHDLALGYALLLASDFTAAAAPAERIWRHTAPTGEEHADVVLAWVRLEAGKPEDAAALLRANPIPDATGPGPFTSFVFPRIFYLRAMAAESAGRTDEARTNYRLFVQLSGDRPLVWGEEKKAAAKAP